MLASQFPVFLILYIADYIRYSCKKDMLSSFINLIQKFETCDLTWQMQVSNGSSKVGNQSGHTGTVFKISIQIEEYCRQSILVCFLYFLNKMLTG